MTKGTTGITYVAYATAAFILAICNQTTLLALLLGFVLVVEKNEWLGKQVIQAFLLCITYSFLANCLDVFDILTYIPFVGSVISAIISGFLSIVSLVCLIFSIIALLHVIKGEDAKLPLFSKIANWAFGIITKTVKVTTETIAPAPVAEAVIEPTTEEENKAE
ncbi:MAG: hypothetical protein R3Y47_02260 [Lachnospiraceae bacterium]